jgi:hypothetical protein
LEENTTGGRELDATIAPMEELELEFFLQLLNSSSHRRLNRIEPLRRSSEMKLFGNYGKLQQRSKIHVLYLAQTLMLNSHHSIKNGYLTTSILTAKILPTGEKANPNLRKNR